jgi:hypothetical protein
VTGGLPPDGRRSPTLAEAGYPALVIASTGIAALLVFSACRIIARLCLPRDPLGELTARCVCGPGADLSALGPASLPPSPAAAHIASAGGNGAFRLRPGLGAGLLKVRMRCDMK